MQLTPPNWYHPIYYVSRKLSTIKCLFDHRMRSFTNDFQFEQISSLPSQLEIHISRRPFNITILGVKAIINRKASKMAITLVIVRV